MSATLILGHMLWADTTQPPRPGWGVAVEGERVIATGPHGTLRARFPGATVVEAMDCVITPALVNAHHHMYGVLAHGIPLEEAPAGFWPFLEDFWWPRVEDRLTHDLIAAATDWACLEMVRSGVTTFYDCLETPHAILRQSQDTASRCLSSLTRRRALAAGAASPSAHTLPGD